MKLALAFSIRHDGNLTNMEQLVAPDSSSCDDIHDCRTLSSIILTCLVTLAACTWVSIHPNVPDRTEGELTLTIRRLKLMLLALLAPEIIVLWALRQRMVAKKLSRKHNMTMVHAFFVSMGGFVVSTDRGITPVQSHMIGPGMRVDPEDLTAKPMKEILDRSKGDAMTKGVAMIQTTWFLIQCIARRVQGLAITELEIVTIAFASLNFIIYCIWWFKPLDVRWPMQIDPASNGFKTVGGRITVIPQLIFKSPIMALQGGVDVCVWIFAGESSNEQLPAGATRVPTLWAGRLSRRRAARAAGFAIFIAIGFGAIHFAAWNFIFPTNAERILWRVASAAVVGIPAIFFLDALYILRSSPPTWYHRMTVFVVIPSGVTIYLAGRITLMVLPFVALRALPADAYKDIDWTHFIPHIS